VKNLPGPRGAAVFAKASSALSMRLMTQRTVEVVTVGHHREVYRGAT
jgi:hypothetical protein